jgi:Kef-type K+ transport system membrane component KefB
LIAAKIGGELALRIGQPPVLGELLAGVALGNLPLLGIHGFSAEAPGLAFLAELGVVLLLFEVGLESTLAQMRAVGGSAAIVAVVGVVAPMLLGYGVSSLITPGGPVLHLFVGATLCATSVGITARVLKDAGAMERREARIVLGAAVLDDVLGLVVLAVVTAIAQKGALPSAGELARIVLIAVGFLGGALLLGRYGFPGVFRIAARLHTDGVLGALAIGVCLLLAGVSALAGLAAIVGAFAAGLVLDDVHVKEFGSESKHDVGELVRPIAAVLIPVFFVRTGMGVNLGQTSLAALGFGVALTLAAVVGKLVTGLAVRREPGIDRLLVGVGMIPRGEVGLIFADAGARLVVGGQPLVSPSVYAALVFMVLATTVVAPPSLMWRLRRCQ